MTSNRDGVELETGPAPVGAVLWLHGLGADGHDFEPIVPALRQRGDPPLRFIFPHAPVRPVTLNGGYPMRAWYDILGLDRSAAQDEAGIRASYQTIRQWIVRENERGIPTERIVLAGFSQGGVMALFAGTRLSQRIAGIIALSCYVALPASLESERTAINQTTPIFMAHGEHDPVIDIRYGLESRRALEAAGYAVEWHSYPIPHSVSPEEITDIAIWLRQVL